MRIFALDRIRRATLTTEGYEIPRGFTFRKYMSDAFAIQKGEKPVAVSVRFAPRHARWIRERRWHRTARVQEELDGGLVLHLQVAETSEIKRWVLQFAPRPRCCGRPRWDGWCPSWGVSATFGPAFTRMALDPARLFRG